MPSQNQHRSALKPSTVLNIQQLHKNALAQLGTWIHDSSAAERPVWQRCFTTSTQFQPRTISPFSSCLLISFRFCAFVNCSFFFGWLTLDVASAFVREPAVDSAASVCNNNNNNDNSDFFSCTVSLAANHLIARLSGQNKKITVPSHCWS